VPTAYVRRVSLKTSLSDAEVAAYWKFTMEEVVPAIQRVPGMRSVKVYSGSCRRGTSRVVQGPWRVWGCTVRIVWDGVCTY
jgi:hypothetical protein